MESNTNSKRVLVTLTPTGRFYFGGDTILTLSSDDKHLKKNNRQTSYIVESNKFPQQTSLLGMLRFLILSNNTEAFDVVNQKIINKDKAAQLIGRESFSIKNEKLNFGYIKEIEQCAIQMQREGKSWEMLYTPPLDYGQAIQEPEMVKATINGRELLIPSAIENYNPKKEKEVFYLTSQGEKIKESLIFTKDVRIGIEKDFEGKTKSNAFYKQISYRLGNNENKDKNSKFRFAFYATFYDGLDTSKLNGQTVLLGGDSSTFVLNIEEPKEELYPDLEIKTSYVKRLVLTSETYLPYEDLEFSYALTDTIPFRFLETKVSTENYNINKKDSQVSRSSRYELFKKGSVFYFDTEESYKTFINKIDAQLCFKQIGYNQYQ